jgi:hypothetical protein
MKRFLSRFGFGFLGHIMSMAEFFQLPREQRRIIFYSEGKVYWVHLEGVLKEFLKISDIPVCYITSGEDDPGLNYKHPNLRSFRTDEGWVRNWLFENIDTDVMVMTMPDLHRYQVKRSRHPVHYVHILHSLVSLHMVYRTGAFDHFDSIFCAGPHHVCEIRAMEKKYNLSPKNVVEHGYGRLDAIIESAQKRPRVTKESGQPKHVLIAPSWGMHGLIETVGDEVVSRLLNGGFKVTLRPHPQTLKFSMDKVKAIADKHADNHLFELEMNVASQETLHQSDIMISDWSGAALDYAFGLSKPVLFIDVPRKVNNKNYQEIGIEPFEVSIRNKIGEILHPNDIPKLVPHVNSLLYEKKSALDLLHENVFNINKSASIGAFELVRLAEK